MSFTPFFAQAAGSAGMGELVGMVIPLGGVMIVFWFFLIRPQQRKLKEQQDMIAKVTRGDTVITAGGLIGKVTKVVDDKEVLVEIGENVKVRVLRQGITDVRAKGEPIKETPAN